MARKWSWIGWSLVIAASALITFNSLPYFVDPERALFLQERPELTAGRSWRTFLLTHVFGGVICLLAGPILIWNLALRKSRTLHRWLGWTYVVSALAWAVPTGIYLSFYAKGGAWGASGFLVTDLLWAIATVAGVIEIRRGNVAFHAAWMARSYAIVLSAVFFRIIFVIAVAAGGAHIPSYVAAIWGSLLVSLIVGEGFAAQLRRHQRVERLFLPFGKRQLL